jgi:tetratricopeptide (TPR) repeat protein
VLRHFKISNRGAALNHLGRYQESIQDLNNAIRLNSNAYVSFMHRAYSYYRLNKIKEAFQVCKKKMRMMTS